MAHKAQGDLWRALGRAEPYEFSQSILGFLEERGGLLHKLMLGNYLARLLCNLLAAVGFSIRFGSVLVWLVWFGLVWFGLVWFGLVWFGLVRFGSVCFGSVCFVLGLVLVWFGFSLVCQALL